MVEHVHEPARRSYSFTVRDYIPDPPIHSGLPEHPYDSTSLRVLLEVRWDWFSEDDGVFKPTRAGQNLHLPP